MPIIVTPYIPTSITVHLGPPDSNTENITVPFRDYIKNVASSEVYPTWHYSSLRANILAQVSFALNRVYTEFYRSQGYSFNITSTTAYDQRFIPGRNIFENISILVDELFDDYIRRQNFVEPLAARFCNGTTSRCDGLSQWGSEYLAQEGQNSIEILKSYYGENIELVTNAPMQDIQNSYPGTSMRFGDRSAYVRIAQIMLNRVSKAYPAIPYLSQPDGYFGRETEASVRQFQQIFNLAADGVVGKATWYRMVHLYTGILQLSELVSEGQTFAQLDFDPDVYPAYGESNERVALLQYLLSVLSQFYLSIPFITTDGVYGDETRNAVIALQREAGLPQTGFVDSITWDALLNRFLGIDRALLSSADISPFTSSSTSTLSPEQIQNSLMQQPERFPELPLIYGQSDR